MIVSNLEPEKFGVPSRAGTDREAVEDAAKDPRIPLEQP